MTVKMGYLREFSEPIMGHFYPRASPSSQLRASRTVHTVHLKSQQKYSVLFFMTKHFSHQGVSFTDEDGGSVFRQWRAQTLRESTHLTAALLPRPVLWSE